MEGKGDVGLVPKPRDGQQKCPECFLETQYRDKVPSVSRRTTESLGKHQVFIRRYLAGSWGRVWALGRG